MGASYVVSLKGDPAVDMGDEGQVYEPVENNILRVPRLPRFVVSVVQSLANVWSREVA